MPRSKKQPAKKTKDAARMGARLPPVANFDSMLDDDTEPIESTRNASVTSTTQNISSSYVSFSQESAHSIETPAHRSFPRVPARPIPRRTLSSGHPPKSGVEPRPKKQRRYRPGTRALMEIRKYQKSCDLLIRKLPFLRLVREIISNTGGGPKRVSGGAACALQEAAEAYLVQFFEDAHLLSVHGGRVTVMVRDFNLIKRLRGNYDIL